MASQPSPAPVSLVTPDGRISVHFVWQGDRYVHRVGNGDSVNGAAHSIDGDANEDWPASPPLQQLSSEVIDGSDVILGVGAAGRSHWSVSVRPVETKNGQGLKFEWACRHKTEAEFLGTTYKNGEAVKLAVGTDAKSSPPSERVTTIEPVKISDSGTDCWSYVYTSRA